jgi:hypothetical protein
MATPALNGSQRIVNVCIARKVFLALTALIKRCHLGIGFFGCGEDFENTVISPF